MISGDRQFDVLAVGEAMVLITPEGRLSDADTFRADVAGAESNVALHLAALGRPVGWAGGLGDDALGFRVRRRLEAAGVTVFAAPASAAPTGVMFKDPHPGGSVVSYYRRGSAASQLGAGFAKLLPLADARVVHLSGVTPALAPGCAKLADAIVSRARSCGTTVSFDVNFRPRLWPADRAAAVLLRLARAADIVFVGRDEAAALWATDDPDSIRSLLGGPHTVIVKDGAVGATEYLGAESTFVPAPVIEVVEQVGAGDAFAAGYLSAWLAGSPSADRMTTGHSVAALAMSTVFDVPTP
ncbi:sugar kinase [Amnibacterium sp. CER49]|uniref:sugar kinase n=1 Tax=Amnibacterium sp. CER49 TaxID=3039161 RepID=UPI00244BB183|nr:sugar kinase [Amnibacterium sp. CER49]MDH2442846.1 sugar kinase [Amnibacterium sp. CER49]